MQVNVYLNFKGNTEEAFLFYRKVFGGEFAVLQRFRDVESLPEKETMSEVDLDKIMHISLPVGENVLMGTDVLESLGQDFQLGNNISLSIDPPTRDDADQLFAALGEDGAVEMPLMDVFWGAYFGMVCDKFGVKWMVNCVTSGSD